MGIFVREIVVNDVEPGNLWALLNLMRRHRSIEFDSVRIRPSVYTEGHFDVVVPRGVVKARALDAGIRTLLEPYGKPTVE